MPEVALSSWPPPTSRSRSRSMPMPSPTSRSPPMPRSRSRSIPSSCWAAACCCASLSSASSSPSMPPSSSSSSSCTVAGSKRREAEAPDASESRAPSSELRRLWRSADDARRGSSMLSGVAGVDRRPTLGDACVAPTVTATQSSRSSRNMLSSPNSGTWRSMSSICAAPKPATLMLAFVAPAGRSTEVGLTACLILENASLHCLYRISTLCLYTRTTPSSRWPLNRSARGVSGCTMLSTLLTMSRAWICCAVSLRSCAAIQIRPSGVFFERMNWE
mmetsp:Transcript_26032/g.83725  ORF Transcript_26032/g.83725 Transcript_26032/m.83725 type:complete len:275 (-) Transcript_26032:68-892(-)